MESLVRDHQDLDEATVTKAKDYLNIGRQVKAQDVEEAADGAPKLRKGVAKDRRRYDRGWADASRTEKS